MAIIIHQALCGELNKAWDLIDSTMEDVVLAKKIAFKTDLQDSPPSGVDWSPAIRGFAYEQYFLLIKTYLDTSADVRNGRVFSHCLIIKKDDLSEIDDLTILISHFQPELNKSLSLKPITYHKRETNMVKLPSALQGRFNRVIKSFLNLESFENTVIWSGKEDFELALCRFWQLLDVSQKAILNFGINFNPTEIPKGRINFIAVPETIEVKFENKGFCLVKKTDQVVLSEFSEQYLAGDDDFESRLKAFANAFEFKKFTYHDVPLIAKGVHTFETLKTVKDARILNTFANIVSKFAPDPIQGKAAKTRIISQIVSVFKTADRSEILLLKNFPIQSFNSSIEELTIVTEEWLDKYLLLNKVSKSFNDGSFVLQIIDSSNRNWWAILVEEKIKSFFSRADIKGAKVFWNWVVGEPKVLDTISPYLKRSANFETLLLNAIPKELAKTLIVALKSLTVEFQWYKLYAALSLKQFDLDKAVTAQLQVDKHPESIEGLSLLTEGQPGESILVVATNHNDERLFNIAAKQINLKPQLLEKINVEQREWQKIWTKVIRGGLPIAKSLKDVQKVIYQFFDVLTKGKPFEKDLLSEISETDYANILNYPKRSILWAKLPKDVKDRFLIKTSSSFLEQLSKNSTITVPEERDLSDYIQNSAIGTFLYYNRNNLKSALPIFLAYRQIPEGHIKQYIDNYGGSIDVIDASNLGRMAAQRNFEQLAYSIYHKTSYHKNFKVALGECYSLMDFYHRGLAWAKGAIKHIEVSPDEWWSSFTEISYKLYSGGPTENKIWKQADGEEYDLLVKGTGKEVWIAALNKLRNGGCAGITTKKLLKKMIAEHGRVAELNTLKELYKKI